MVAIVIEVFDDGEDLLRGALEAVVDLWYDFLHHFNHLVLYEILLGLVVVAAQNLVNDEVEPVAALVDQGSDLELVDLSDEA